MALCSIQLDACPPAVLVAFRGAEEISRLSRFDAFVRTPQGVVIDEEAALWSHAVLSMGHPGAPDGLQRWHGVVRAVTLVEATSPLEGRLWQVTIVPSVYPKLTLSRHSRVFTGLDLKGLLEDLIDRCGLVVGTDVRLAVGKSYPVEEQVTQYRESDLDFLSRWLEHHGVRFWFEHLDERDVLVISDGDTDPALRERAARFTGVGGAVDATAEEAFHVLRGAHRTRPAVVEIDDHDYGNPTLQAPERRTISRDGLGRVRAYGERAVTPEYLGPTADRRRALWAGGAAGFEAAGDVGGLRAGYAFSVEDHPREAMNATYLAVRVEHQGREGLLTPALARQIDVVIEGDRLYQARVLAVRSGSAFHPPLRTARPRGTGVERAHVDGPADHHYAQLDEQGRYRVRFDFDEGDGAAGKASVAVRMLQPHTGNPEGMHFPLRKGTEVLVAFVGGDPDRPAIVGSVPDAHRPSPVTSANGTLNVVHTGSDTRLEIEDQADHQSIALSTPPMTTRWHMGKPHDSSFQGTFTHHFVETTDADCGFFFGGDQDVNVGAKLWEIVDGAALEIYKTSLQTDVTGPETTHVTGPVIELYGATQTTEVTGLVTETYDSIQLTAVAGLRDEAYFGAQTTDVKGFVVELYAGTQDKAVSGGQVTETYNGPLIQSVGGAVTQTYAAPVKTDYGPTVLIQPSITMNVPGGITMTVPSWTEIISVKVPQRTILDAVATTQTGIKGITITLSMVAKFEYVGALAEATGVKMEASGPNLTLTNAHLSLVGIKTGTFAGPIVKSNGFTKLGP